MFLTRNHPCQWLVLSILLTTGCASRTPIPTEILKTTNESVLAFDKNAWLSVRAQGIFYNNKKILEGRFELLDARHHQNEHVALTLNANREPVLLTRRDSSQFQQRRGKALDFAAEALCLFEDSADHLQVFILGEDGIARQYLLAGHEQLDLQLIRQFPISPAAEYCAVDDAHAALYISEETIGVWRYNARAESELTRDIVVWAQPRGPLKRAGALAAAAGTLIVAELEGHSLHTFKIASQHSPATRWTLAPKIAVEKMHVTQKENELHISVYDDNASRTHYFKKTMSADGIRSLTIPGIVADAETQPVDNPGDAADDPAIWVHPSDATRSLILGTNKQQGLDVYGLAGERQQHLAVGRVNNVDVRQDFSYKGQTMDIAAASQRDTNSIALFSIAPESGNVTPVTNIPTNLEEVYGLCLYRGRNQLLYVFINDKNGQYQQYHIIDSKNGWHGKRVREFSVDSQPEGCSADERNRQLFLGEEARGVWRIGAEPGDGTKPELILTVDNKLVADVEGMEVYDDGNIRYLVVSSQGNDSYLVYAADPPYRLLGHFRIVLNREQSIDGASETDGLTVTSAALGSEYPLGILVVQDGRNLLPPATQNFKIIDWRKVVQILKHSGKLQ